MHKALFLCYGDPAAHAASSGKLDKTENLNLILFLLAGATTTLATTLLFGKPQPKVERTL